MNVAIVAGKSITPQMGGQGTFCAEVAAGLARLGHDVRLLVLNEPDWKQWANKRSDGRILVKSPSLAVLQAADVIHINTPWLRILAWGFVVGRPTVVTHQDFRAACPAGSAWSPEGPCSVKPGQLGPCEYCPARRRYSRKRLQLQTALMQRAWSVAVSQCVKNRLGLQDFILGPIDANRVPDLSECRADGRLAFIGRLAPEKGVQVALRALGELPSEVGLDVYGDGPAKADLEVEALRLNLARRVRFHGHVAEPVMAAKTAAAIVVPSLWDEPFGYVTAEAMASGKAVIAAATGASVELLAGERGWLVPPGDPRALARAVEEVLGSPAERTRRGQLARHFALTSLNPVEIAERYERVYQNVLSGSPAKRTDILTHGG